MIGIPFYVIGQGLNGIIRADGSLKYDMIATLSGAILNIILDPILAKKHCVIIGRCADYILKDKKDVYNVFLYSSMDKKIDRVTKYYGIDVERAKNKINKVNKRRAKHYEYYTNQKWNDVGNYDLAVNVDTLGVENTALMIKNIIENGK